MVRCWKNLSLNWNHHWISQKLRTRINFSSNYLVSCQIISGRYVTFCGVQNISSSELNNNLTSVQLLGNFNQQHRKLQRQTIIFVHFTTSLIEMIKNHFFHDYLTLFHSYPKSGDKIKHFLEMCLRVLHQISENRRWFEFEKRGFLSGLLHHSARLHHSIFGKLSSLHPPFPFSSHFRV